MIFKGPLLDSACSSGLAKNRPRTNVGWDEGFTRTTRQPGLCRRPEFRAWLIHDFDPMKNWIEDHPDCRGNATNYPHGATGLASRTPTLRVVPGLTAVADGASSRLPRSRLTTLSIRYAGSLVRSGAHVFGNNDPIGFCSLRSQRIRGKRQLLRRRADYTSHGDDCVIVGWVKPTGLTPFAVGFTHPTNGSPVPACGISPVSPGFSERTRRQGKPSPSCAREGVGSHRGSGMAPKTGR